jgi:hypothetical protein
VSAARSVLLSICCSLAVAEPLRAQQRPTSDSLPRELVIALLGGSLGGSRVDVRAGLADDSLPAELFRDALVLGFADYRTATTTVAWFPYAPQATIDTIKTRLVAAGWKAAPQTEDTQRGFVTAFGGTRPQAICRDRVAVVPTVMVRSINRTLAVISRQFSQGAEFLCGGDPMRIARRDAAADSPLPALVPPPGMQSRGGGSSGMAGGDRSMTMSTTLNGVLPVRDILAHYAGLFTTEGWRKVDEAATGSVAIATFEITAKGARWHCAFVISAPTDDSVDVHLTLRML